MTRDTGWRYSPVCWLTSDYASCPRTSGVAPRHCPAAVVSVAGKLSKNIWMSLSRCWPGPPRAARCWWWLLGSSCFVQLFMEHCPDCPNLRLNQSDVMMGNSEDNVVMIRHYLPCFPKMKLQFRSINLSTTSLKSLRLRKLLDPSVLAYWALLGPSWSFFLVLLLGPSRPFWVLLGLTWPYLAQIFYPLKYIFG